MDVSVVRVGDASLLTYLRYSDKGEFVEEMSFCKSWKNSTNRHWYIYI